MGITQHDWALFETTHQVPHHHRLTSATLPTAGSFPGAASTVYFWLLNSPHHHEKLPSFLDLPQFTHNQVDSDRRHWAEKQASQESGFKSTKEPIESIP